MVYKIVSFDGLSLSGKTTMGKMLKERSLDAEIVRENTYDPHRPATSRLNKLLKELDPFKAVKKVSKEFQLSKQVLGDSLEYSSIFEGSSRKQAMLAYMFTAGRKVVDEHVREAVKEHDVILDRWKMTGMAYQVEPEGYGWQKIQTLNDVTFGILTPDIQILLTCPIEQIPIRRAYREKVGVGTAGQMSRGREHVILPAFIEIYECFESKIPIYLFENVGTPVEDIKGQIRQAIPTFKRIEAVVRENGFRLKEEEIVSEESFWLDPERLERIYRRQTSKK
ncbi:MAG: hypothetical protein GTN36_02465 [Candidatus Aenigmarchaeota archaeon]|nr:hypothetical protein [Candidatus Aenigmarchaeota archaeon]